ncbi:insulinase family protein [bacterium]|nr:insulinase family protein [bacterium]
MSAIKENNSFCRGRGFGGAYKAIFALIFLLQLTLALSASPAAAEPAGGSERYIGKGGSEGETYYRETLPNGMQLILCEDYSSPVCSVNIFCRVGGFEENSETMGISHFYEHLFFRGTPGLSGYQFKRAIEALGGVTNANTGQDFTHYFITLPSKNALAGMRLLADALKNAEMSQEAIDQERNAVLEEYRMNLESPVRIINNILNEMAYENHPYSRPVIGTESTIRSFNRGDFLKFRDTFITPERVIAVVTGDFRRSEMLALLRREFSGFERGRRRIIADYSNVIPPQREVSREQSVPAPLNFAVLGFVGPSVKDKPDIYRADVMSFLMGVGRGSLIQRRLVKEGKIREGGVQFMTQRFPGLITLYGVNPVESNLDVKKELLQIVEAVKKGDFTERDLRRAKAFLKSNYLISSDTSAGKAENLGFYAAIDDVSFIDGYLREIDKVTREDVMKAAEKYLGGGYYYVLLKGQSPKADKTEEESGRRRRERM